jgi:putative ABC transport system permease protein
MAIGRMKEGLNVRSVESEMTGILQRMSKKYPGQHDANDGVTLQPVRDVLVGGIKTPLLLLLGAVGFVLLIACANVANLFLARGEVRHKEIAIRKAMGASAGRIISMLFVESILLALMGGVAGLAIAFWGLDAMIAISPARVLDLQNIKMDSSILFFTFLVSALSGILFGMAPAFQMARSEVQSWLKDTTRGTTSGVRGSRVRNMLVVSEIALSVVLVIGAGLLIRSFYKLQRVSPGFNSNSVLSVRFDLPEARYPQAFQAAQFYDQLLSRINSLPSVKSSADAIFIPLFNSESNWGFEIEGRTQEGAKVAYYNMVSPDYFKVLEVPLLHGRFFTKQDQEKTEGAVIINETTARRFWKDENPVGKRINVNMGIPVWREIVGVVGDVRNISLGAAPDLQMYFPLIDAEFATIRMGNLLIRTESNPLALVEPVKSEIRSLDPNLPFATVRTLDEIVSTSVAQPRFTTALLGLFASIAMLLAAIGIYGVISYSVARRTHEIGIRMALGARRNQIVNLVVGQGVALAAIGVAIGLIAAILLTRVMSSLLFEISATDPVTFVVISAVLGFVALIASYVPARRAAKVDPMIALRYE